MIEELVTLEKPLFLALNSFHTPYLDAVMYVISAPFVWYLFGVWYLSLIIHRQYWKEWLCIILFITLLIFIADSISSGIFKPIFQRLRPTYHPETASLVQTVFGYRGGRYGFISGHSLNFISLATFTSLFVRNTKYTVLISALMLTVCYSRIYLGVHFISDVIPAIILGILNGCFVFYLYQCARHLFLGVPHDSLKIPFPKPHHTFANRITLFVFLFTLGVWLFAPLIIYLYK